MKISTKLRPEELPAHIGEKIKNLTELTGGQNAGILIHDEQVIVCDWSEAEGLPYVTFSYDLIFTDGDDITLTGVKYIEDVREALPGTMEYDPQRKTLRGRGMDILSDTIGDIPALFGYRVKGGRQPEFAEDGSVLPVPAVCYYLTGGGEIVIAVAPESWK